MDLQPCYDRLKEKKKQPADFTIDIKHYAIDSFSGWKYSSPQNSCFETSLAYRGMRFGSKGMRTVARCYGKMVIADAKCATALGRVAATVRYLSY